MSSGLPPPGGNGINPGPRADDAANAAERFAVLAQQEQREAELRRRRTRRWAIYLPLAIFIGGCLWAAVGFLRVIR